MKFLYMEIIRQNIGRTRYFQYLNYEIAGDRFYFAGDLGIIHHNNASFLQSVAKGEA